MISKSSLKNDSSESFRFYENSIIINSILLIFNFTLFLLKLIFSSLTKSISLQADAFDSLTDIVMYSIALIAISFANKKPNERFPYGYYKLENIISLMISFFIFFTGSMIIFQFFSNIFKFFKGKQRILNITPLIFVFLIISLLISIMIMFFLKVISKKTNSPIIASEAREKIYDVFISLSVVIGFIGVLFELYILDSIIGLLIAFFIIKGGYDLFLKSTKVLLDAIIDFDKRTELYALIENIPKIKKIKNLALRAYGKYVFLELELILNKNFPLSQIEILKRRVREEVKINFPKIFKILIIINSEEKSVLRIAVPLKKNQGYDSIIAEDFGKSPYFGILELKEGNLSKFEIIVNKFISEEKRKGLLISEWLISYKIDKIYVKKQLNKGPSLIFSNNFVKMENTSQIILKEIIEKEEKSTNS
ncbi:MAG: cation diffusion facilitator family transporter [Promethearchaeota archaeon]